MTQILIMLKKYNYTRQNKYIYIEELLDDTNIIMLEKYRKKYNYVEEILYDTNIIMLEKY
jgi:hypothetical protein